MNILIGVNADAAGLGAKWMHIIWSKEHNASAMYMLKHMQSGGTWKHVDEIVMAGGFCDIAVYDCWPYKALPPDNGYIVTEESLELALTDAQLDRVTLKTEYERVSVSAYGHLVFMADYKHSASWEGVIASFSIDIEDITTKPVRS
jgi:hypothetical protein